MTCPRPWERENGTRRPFSWPHRQTDQGVRPYSSTRSPFDGLNGRSRSVGTPFGLRPHFSFHSKGEPEPTREKIHKAGHPHGLQPINSGPITPPFEPSA